MEKPLFSFGVIADVQYADRDDGSNYRKTRRRYYRNSLNLLHQAIDDWLGPETEAEDKVSFILNLGDLIDGCNKQLNMSESSLQRTLEEFERFPGAVYHTWGNHEFYNFSRDQLVTSSLNSKLKWSDNSSESIPRVKAFDSRAQNNNDGQHDFEKTNFTNGESAEFQYDPGNACYYDFSPYPGFRVVVLDSYEFSMLGYPKDHPVYREAEAVLRKYNSNELVNSAEGMEGLDVRFVEYNGGMSQNQLDWLETILTQADHNNEVVIVATHQPVYPEAGVVNCLLWNFEDLLSILQQHHCVKLYLSGHEHDGGSVVDDKGIQHVTFEGIIETEPGNNAYGTVHVYREHLVLEGVGKVTSLNVKL